MDLSVIVVHYKTPHLLTRLLDTLLNPLPGISFEVLVLDNGGDESLHELLPRDSRTSLYTLGENVGFAKAANEGMRKATGHYFLLANSDVEFPAGSVASCHEDAPPQGVTLRKAVDPADAVGPVRCRVAGREELLQITDAGGFHFDRRAFDLD